MRKRLRAASATALCLLLVSAGGCAKVIGLDDFKDTDEAAEEERETPPAGLSCDLPRITNSCANCLHTACEAECRGCGGNPDCKAILDCTEDCTSGTGTCFNDCIENNPGGADDFLNLYSDVACAFTTCKLACLGRRGDLLEPCNLGEQCASGLCSGRVGGWCTAQCATSADCGEGNGCIALPNANVCFIGCATNADCYPGLVCQAANDVSGVTGKVCAGIAP
ncbi:MAG: hypothetical protein M3020_28090 [Myxococcota bacterium]|jgi:hypothetical protein|nr:hypothetical protein [Myxococcota bacterium]